ADPTLAFKSWDFYNREIITIYKKHEEDSIIVHIDDVIADVASTISNINTRFGFHLKHETVGTIFDKSMYKCSDENLFYSLQTALAFPEIINTLNELRTLSGKEIFKLEKDTQNKMAEKAIGHFVTGWSDLYFQKQKVKILEEEIALMKQSRFWKLRQLLCKLKG
ncbi:MAG TPA: hypothetical protein VNW06_01685, partial [Cytophagaceae bacterium]|nr:hypothetical protein [Cytophagaceae bacterium]